MNDAFANIRVLLIQARSDMDMVLQERACFLERCNLAPHQLISANVMWTHIHPGMLAGVDAMFIGGAGEFSATQNYTWMESLLNLVRRACECDFPVMGCCWGHQIIARALGGTVVHDPKKAEMGCHLVRLTEEGCNDPLFQDYPTAFRVNMGHHDRISSLPKEAVELAHNVSQPYEAFRIKNKPIYGTQFHSELDSKRERERLINYREFYLKELPTDDLFQQVIDDLADTTEVDRLLLTFLNQFALSKNKVGKNATM